MNWTMIILGCVGGAIPDVIRIIQNRHKPELPDYVGSMNFWLGLVLLVLLGGFAAWLGGASDYKAALAFGFAAPEIVSRLLSSGPGVKGPGTGVGDDTRRFWAF
jgi:hypothetical protein